MALFRIRDYIEGANLREVTWRASFLQSVVEEFGLRSGECVVFENAMRTKARLVANVGGLPILFIPPIDPKRQLSVHLEVNIALRGASWQHNAKVASTLEENEAQLQDRLYWRDLAKTQAAKARRAEKRHNGGG